MKWNKEQTPVPENYYILPEDKVMNWIDYDFILIQSKFWQYQVSRQILENIKIPTIVLEHTLPTPQTLSEEQIDSMRDMLGDTNVFISEYSKDEWQISNNAMVIHHGVDTETFRPIEVEKNNYALTVANNFKNRDYCLNYKGWQNVTKDIDTKLIGKDNGEDVKSCKDTEELVKEYNSCSVYLNTTTLSPIPMSLLEAMACGCAVVSTATCMIPEVIDNGVNGYISNDESELSSYIKKLLSDETLRKEMGSRARETIKEKFSETKFIENWNNLFNKTYEEKTK